MPPHVITPPVSFILLFIITIFSSSAHAVTFTVTNLDDSGIGSLRQAILDANNATATDDTIVFQSGLSGLLLTAGGMTITGNLTLEGPGNSVTINGNNAARIFTVNAGVTATFSKLKLRNGGIDNNGTLTINDSTIESSTWSDGGAISNSASGTLTVNDSILSDNSATHRGGGIFNNNGMITISNCSILNNSASVAGGGIDNYSGSATINNTIISNNLAVYGGGLHNVYGTSIMFVSNSTLSNNTASLSGGGIQHGRGSSTLTVRSSTLSGNSALGGASGIDNGGGGIYAYNAPVTLINNTVTGNSAATPSGPGGGIRLNGGVLSIGNTLVVGNTSPNGKEIYVDSGATFTSLGHNLFGESGSSGLINASPIDSDLILSGPVSTAIGPLADNGGPTQTHLLLPGSPALDAGDNLLVQNVTTAQRGETRIQNGVVDIGAVEGTESFSSTDPLTVTKTGGNGTVTSDPAGIACGTTCTADFTHGIDVTLTAAPDAGYSVSGWSGDCSGTGAICTVTMDAAKTVTALFANVAPTTYLLTTTTAGTGTGTVNGAGSYAEGVAITLTAIPGAGSTFIGWSPSPCATRFAMPANDLTCTATFTATQQDPATTLITHYYVSILERAPETDGLAFWQQRIADNQAQGADVKPVFRDMANFFFNSPEYLGRGTTDRQFITNLYLTFFQREPDEGGYAFWLDQLAGGMTRNQAMSGFLFSPEFTDFMKDLGF